MYNLFLRLKLHNYKIIRPKMNLSKEIKRERERIWNELGLKIKQ